VVVEYNKFIYHGKGLSKQNQTVDNLNLDHLQQKIYGGTHSMHIYEKLRVKILARGSAILNVTFSAP
jgi:hypothetical protein